MRLAVSLVLALVVTSVLAKGNGKSKRMDRGGRNKRLDNRILNAKEGGMEEGDDETDQMEVRSLEDDQDTYRNPCNNKKCKRGEACILEGETPVCVCQTCEETEETVVKVCSTTNVTYESECELDRDHCLCKNEREGCSQSDERKVRLDYFAACKELTKCPDDELQTFPERMRSWLYRVMRELAMRAELEDYRDMLEEAQRDENHAAAVVWKFCDLDTHPADSQVSRRELMYIIASIKPMEHCLVRFLNKCDADNDNAISRLEWGECLGIEKEKLYEKCKPVHAHRVKQ